MADALSTSVAAPRLNRAERQHLEEHRPPLDVAGAARYLGTTERHVRRLVFERRIAFLKLGAKIRFRPDDLDAFLVNGRVEAVR